MDWVPLAGSGIVVAGGLLAVWQWKGAMAEKVKNIEDSVKRLSTEERVSALERRLDEHIQSNIRERQEMLESLREVKDDIRSATAEMRTAAALITTHSTEQSSVNRSVEQALRGLVNRIEDLDRRVDSAAG